MPNVISLATFATETILVKPREMVNHAAHLIQRGKKLSYLLRHDKTYAFDEHGWREVNDLVANHGFTMEELREIVATNNKQRYEFSRKLLRFKRLF